MQHNSEFIREKYVFFLLLGRGCGFDFCSVFDGPVVNEGGLEGLKGSYDVFGLFEEEVHCELFEVAGVLVL